MPDPVRIHIDYDTLKEVAYLGVRRAYVFMGIGTNAAQSDPPIAHALSRRERVIIVPDDVPEETRRHFAEEFEAWIVGNGLRELIDTLSNYLTELQTANSLVLRQVPLQGLDQQRSRFDKMSIREQLAAVCQLLGMPNEYATMIESWRRARNCLTHRMGVVARADCDDGTDVLTLRWQGFQYSILEPDGRTTVLDLEGNEEEVLIENGGVVQVASVERTKTFAINQVTRISGHELSEICMTVVKLVDALAVASAEGARAAGVPVLERPDRPA